MTLLDRVAASRSHDSRRKGKNKKTRSEQTLESVRMREGKKNTQVAVQRRKAATQKPLLIPLALIVDMFVSNFFSSPFLDFFLFFFFRLLASSLELVLGSCRSFSSFSSSLVSFPLRKR